MRKYANYALIGAAMLLAIALPTWLAWLESHRQAYEMEASQTMSYAKDVLYRSDAAAEQARERLHELSRMPYPPCSAASLQLMRNIDLSTTYLQAIGHTRNGVMVCSSLGTEPLPLGPHSYLTSNGYRIYPEVPLAGAEPGTLLAIEGGGFAVLIHRDLPIDASVNEPEVSLGLFHVERKQNIIARGHIDPRWVSRLGSQDAASFIDGGQIVSIVKSKKVLVAAIAAAPLGHVAALAAANKRRLVPPALLGGVVIAVLLFLGWRRQGSLDTALRQGLRRDEFYLLYQPIVNLESGAAVGAEALLRWRRRSGEEVSPELFIPVAERSGVICALTDRVMHLIASDTAGYLARHPDFHIAINLSAGDMQSTAIVGKLDRLIEQCGARPSNFILEITERSFLDLDAARPVLQELRARAIEVAIDDFGTGYSSLSYLESLHIDYLKIDRAFIEAIGTDAPTSQVVGHIIEMARTMRLRMIAEGIESEAQAEFLRTRHVQFAQGWSFGKPMPFADVVQHRPAACREPALTSPYLP